MNNIPIPVDTLLVFRDPKLAQELGPVLQVALREVENFFNLGHTRIQLGRSVISEVPILSSQESEWRIVSFAQKAWRALFQNEAPSAEQWNTVALGSGAKELWEVSKGRYVATIDAEKLLAFVRKTVNLSEHTPLLVVIDQQLTPTDDSTYVIARSYGRDDNQAIVSIVPLDPEYWNIPDTNRRATIKQRFRAVSMAFVGELLGFKHCVEPACFMYQFAESPETLDGMVRLGEGHDIPDLTGKGYSPPSGDPTVIQHVESEPQSKGWQALA